ncbi:hypothetical protein [Parabacteroides sp. Marseille-P3160]|uniref:hypothetical protein n=1 Tax=Parabacteroides sp. Marseille-P3160 TaxID=1917887 RepID=UPI00111A420F|nr:hypothetical protein [Parabacteroides sp. Marseille-P3160]
MRKYVLYLSFLSILLFSCRHDSPEEITPALHAIQFRVRLSPEILPFQTRSMPENSIPEPTVENESTENELYNTLEYALYKPGDTIPLRKIEQQTGEEDFGSFLYDSLEAGSYTACFLAYSSPKVFLEGNNAFRFDQMGDAFFLKKAIEVDGKEDQTIDITLQRIVSRVEFAAIDDVPPSVSRFTINVSPVYNRFHLLDGPSAAEPATLFSHLFTPEEKKKGVKNIHAFFTFVPNGETIHQVELAALTTTGDTVHYRKVEAVPIAANKLIRYTGTLYTPGTTENTFEISIEDGGAWADTTHIILPEE